MNLDKGKFEPKFIKIDYKNKIKVINELDIKEEDLDLKAVIQSFEQQVSLDDLNSLIYKLIPKNTNDLFKLNIEQSKLYKKQFPYTKKNLYESVNRILATDYKSNFVFNKQNVGDVSLVLCTIFESIKKYKINNENKLKEKIKNITLNENDIFNMFIDIEMMNKKKSERITRMRKKKIRNTFYGNQNPLFYNSTGNLPMVKELCKEENKENNDDRLTSIKKKKDDLFINFSSDSISENSDEDDNQNKSIIQKFFGKKKKMKKKISDNIFKKNKINNNLNVLSKDDTVVVNKEYFIYPENNYDLKDKNLELPIELIILIKKFENIKSLTFQIKDIDQKILKENIYILFNINLLFPNYTEIKIDLNDENLQKKINKIYEIRKQELFHKFKKDLRKFQYNIDYNARTVNCWDPEGDILFITENEDTKYKYTDFGVQYILGENAYEKSDFFGNKLGNIISDNNSNQEKTSIIKYIIPKKGKNNNFYKNDSIDEFDEEESDDNSLSRLRTSIVSEYPKNDKSKIIPPESKNRSSTNIYLDDITSKKKKKVELGNKTKIRNRNTPELLTIFTKENEAPFEMILIYCWFLEKISKIKTLSLYFYDSFSLETEFFLTNEEIKFEGFHFLFFINKIKKLNEVNFSFNSLDTRSFENILGIIESNKNISILRISFFTPDINFNVTSLLKLYSLMKLSMQTLFKEQNLAYIKEKELKDLEMEYFILNHKLDYFFEKNICCLFNIIKKNIINFNNYEEIVFRLDLPLLILSCDKYIIIIIKFIMNIIYLITFISNKIHTFKLISPELILDGRYTPSLRYLFGEQNNNENIDDNNNIIINKSFKNLNIKCKIMGIPNIFNICLYNNISGLTNINIGDLDLESFLGFLNDYEKNLDKMHSLESLKIGLNNTILEYDKVEKEILKFINIKSKNLKEKVLFCYLQLDNLDKINLLRISVLKANINRLVIQIGQTNEILLNAAEYMDDERYKIELQSLYYIMTVKPYNELAKDKIIKRLRTYFKKNKEKIVVCRKQFNNNDF